MGQRTHDIPDFRLLSAAERSQLAEAIWDRFVATHPESQVQSSTGVQEFARPEVDETHPAPARSWAAARADHLMSTRPAATRPMPAKSTATKPSTRNF